MSQFSAQDVQQLVSSNMKKYKQPTPSSIYNKTPMLSRRGRAQTARRKLVYPNQPTTLVRPDWNPSTLNAPIYMSPPSLRSPHNNSLPRLQQTSEMQLFPLQNGTLPHPRDAYGTPRQHAEYSTLRTRGDVNPEPAGAREAHSLYQKNGQSPNSRRSPSHRKYGKSRHKRSENNISTVRNNLYMTEYF